MGRRGRPADLGNFSNFARDIYVRSVRACVRCLIEIRSVSFIMCPCAVYAVLLS
jgi:hypothetical protein